MCVCVCARAPLLIFFRVFRFCQTRNSSRHILDADIDQLYCRIVCVTRCKTSFHCRGPPGSQGVGGQRRHPWVPVKTYLLSPLGAFKSQLGGHIIYRCCFILSLSPVLTYVYIYIYTQVHLVVLFWFVGVFARPLHSTSQFDRTSRSKCVTHAGFDRMT